jgi:ribonucleotide monophosphatase NagD (HAD superfamily)
MDVAVSTYKLDRSRTVMVGDRLDTDILFGSSNGVDTLMVYTGVNTRAEVHDPRNSIRPTFEAASVADIFAAPPASALK